MSVQIGLRDLYYALLVSDPVGGPPVYETPVRIVGAITANINPNTSAETLFADDGPYEVATTIGDIELEMGAADIPLEVQAALLGHTIVGGILKRKSGDTPPWVAVGFRAVKSNGNYRYTWLAKGKFRAPEQTHETKGDTINFQTPTMSGFFVKRDADDEWERHADADHVDYMAAIGDDWFDSPIGTPDTTPPTVVTAPEDLDTDVAIDADVVITFSEPMALSTITSDNIFLLDSLNAVVAGELTINAARTVVTFTPDADLSNATDYTLTITTNVKDLAGNKLAAPEIATFTTIA